MGTPKIDDRVTDYLTSCANDEALFWAIYRVYRLSEKRTDLNVGSASEWKYFKLVRLPTNNNKNIFLISRQANKIMFVTYDDS